MTDNTQTDILKRYYDMLYPEQLKENEYICLFLAKADKKGNPVLDETGKEINFHRYVKNFEQYQKYINKYKHNFHVYNALATVKPDADGELHRQENNMYQQKVLFIDFDKKDYPNLKNAYDFTRMIKNKLPDLFLHAYYDSGHGYHYYVIIPSTCKVRQISELNKEICSLVGADTNACKVTQAARIPTTFNRKTRDEKGSFPFVKEIDHYQKHPYEVKHFHPCNIDYIKHRIANAKKILEYKFESKPFQEWNYSNDGFDMKVYPCLCTEKILREGAEQHERNTWLGRIISMLKFNRCPESKIREICLEWNTRCRPPKNPDTIKKEIDSYLDKEDIYKLNGCWEKIEDSRVKEIVRHQCDKFHCIRAIQKKDISIEENIGVKMPQKLLTDGKLCNYKDVSLSGYEFLIMTILYKYIKPKSRTPFTIKELKMKMQYKKNEKWQLCMDIKTFKATLERLVQHHCIELIHPTPEQCGKKKAVYDDIKIKIKRGLKILDEEHNIEFYYSTAKAFISKRITQNEFKVFLCIVNNIKEGKSCTMEDLDKILCIGRPHVVEAVSNLQTAQCIDVVQYRSNKGNWYNVYSQKYTDKHNDLTYVNNNDMKNRYIK